MADFFVVFACGILGLMAHGATTRPWLEWLLRIIIGFTFVVECLIAVGGAIDFGHNPWQSGISMGMAIATGIALFEVGRKFYSRLFTLLESVFSGQWYVTLANKLPYATAIANCQVFLPKSIPHMVGLFLYISTFAMLLASVDPEGMKMPGMPIPLPVPIDQLFSYNGLGLVILAFCGCGILVRRKFMEVVKRVAWVKPTAPQVGIGLGLIVFSFTYDWLWAFLTHGMGNDMATKLATYNAGTFSTPNGTLGPSLLLALATAIFAGVGEETLIRGALQPVFGIFPAAVLHGILHGQFNHAPIFMIQVALWSCVMGLVKKYTNTTTTIIGHAGFNFVTTFLFAFNP